MKRIVHTVSIILAVLLAAAGGYYGGKKERPTTGWNHILCRHRGDKGKPPSGSGIGDK